MYKEHFTPINSSWADHYCGNIYALVDDPIMITSISDETFFPKIQKRSL